MTSQNFKNPVPLCERRKDILHHIAVQSPKRSFTCRELLGLFAYPWPEAEDELRKVLSDMKPRRMVRAHPPAPVSEPELRKFDDLVLQIVAHLSHDDIKSIHTGFLRCLLPLKYKSDLYGPDSLGWYIDESSSLLSLSFSENHIGKRELELIPQGGGKPIGVEVISEFFENVYGREALTSFKSILDHKPFSEKATISVLQNLSDCDEQIEELNNLKDHEDIEIYRESLQAYQLFLTAVKEMCEKNTENISYSDVTPLMENKTYYGGKEIIAGWVSNGQKSVTWKQMKNYRDQGLKFVYIMNGNKEQPTCTDQAMKNFIYEQEKNKEK